MANVAEYLTTKYTKLIAEITADLGKTATMWPTCMTRSYETLFNHAIYSDSAGGMDTNHDVTLDNRGAVEIGK